MVKSPKEKVKSVYGTYSKKSVSFSGDTSVSGPLNTPERPAPVVTASLKKLALSQQYRRS